MKNPEILLHAKENTHIIYKGYAGMMGVFIGVLLLL
jgi:uncharacterized membrane protein